MGKIVLLDDQPEICETLEYRLVEEGHEVRTALTGEDAIDLGYLFEPDLLITDWNLESDYDGYEVAEAITYANGDVKTILITGCLGTADSDFQFHAKIPKPFSYDELAAIVDRTLKTNKHKGL